MRLNVFRPVLTAATCLMFTGCNAVDAVNPPGTNTDGVIKANAPVTPLKVRILNGYKGNFQATLDGAPLGGFTPAPARNITVSTPGPACFEGGRMLPGEMTKWREHELGARADSSGPGIKLDSDYALFIPPVLYIQPTASIPLGLGASQSITVALVPGPTASVTVNVIPDGPTVSVNGNPAGQAALMTLPTTGPGTFRLTGVSPGNFIVRLQARGVQCDGISGRVS